LLKVAAPQWRGPRAPEQDLEMAPLQNRIGQGRVTYIPAVRPAMEKPPAAAMSSKYWKLPLNWKELIDGVRWAAGRLSLEVKAPETAAVVAELMDQPGKGRRLVHLINFAGPQGDPVSNVEVAVEVPEGKESGRVTLLTPDGGQSRTVAGRTEAGRVHFAVPQLHTYTLAILELE
ncbi:MAG TPA: hypothetical protein VMW51_09970, partial [Terriglobia bacterium]|nr:hypothetical protein [Terriglobia bacterium]